MKNLNLSEPKKGVMDGNGDIIGLLYCDLYARYKKLSTSVSHDGAFQRSIILKFFINIL